MATSSIGSRHPLSVICSLPRPGHTTSRFEATPVGMGGQAEAAAHHSREIQLLAAHGLGAVLETPAPSSVALPADARASADRRAVTMLLDVRARHHAETSIEIHATVYPEPPGTTYGDPAASEHERFWRERVRTQVNAGAEVVAGRRVRTVAAAVAVAVAAAAADADCVIWLSLGDDGRLADGSSPARAIRAVDEAAAAPVRWFGFEDVYGVGLAAPRRELPAAQAWVTRIGGVRSTTPPEGAAPRELGDRILLAAAAFDRACTFGGCGEGSPAEVQALADRLGR